MELLCMIGYIINLILVLLGKIVRGIIYGIVGFFMILGQLIKKKSNVK